jgi:hypothetical protein
MTSSKLRFTPWSPEEDTQLCWTVWSFGWLSLPALPFPGATHELIIYVGPLTFYFARRVLP